MTATALQPLATSPVTYLAYALLLAMMVGAYQRLLGLFKLGVLVDFLSLPMVVVFSTAGALIIANQKLVLQGLSDVAASLFSGYPVSGSFSRSADNINGCNRLAVTSMECAPLCATDPSSCRI